MTEKNVERKLTTILVSDVVGYSRLMGENQAATLRALQEHQFALLNPIIGQHHGRIVKLMGDGMLVDFQSAVDAVECAIAVQKGMISRNAGVVEHEQIRFRLGMALVHGSAPGPVRGYGTMWVSRAVGIAWDVDTRDAASSSIPSSGIASEIGRSMRLGSENEAI